SAALRRSASSAMALSAPINAPCQTNCSKAHAMACAAAFWSKTSAAFIVPSRSTISLLGRAAVEQPPTLAPLFVRRTFRRQRLHDELRGGPPERPIDQIANELPLRLLLGEPRM